MTALELADELDHGIGTIDRVRHEAAAELRHLHAELERCRQVCDETAEGWREENENTFRQRIRLSRLLEALKEIVAAADGSGWDQLDASFSSDLLPEAAAKLRSLQDELERCRKVSAATSEWWRIERDALLEALKTIEWHGAGSCWVVDADKIAAAIAKAEENNT